jgi:hypothetical protein
VRVHCHQASTVDDLKISTHTPSLTISETFPEADHRGRRAHRPAPLHTLPANISKITGTHNVHLVFSSGASGNPPYVSLHYFNFPTS